MSKHDTFGDHDVKAWTFDWNDQMSYVGFVREVVLEFEVTVRPGMAVDNIEFVWRDRLEHVRPRGAPGRLRPPPGPCSSRMEIG
ncbi:hypothetical protein [Micromonospora sp. WMMD1219]|uniref:hypothetical protein n=1 Tax=Micromonospora sp. WMMD1219 TaxID=3404115 RepID=UPI003BF4AF78